MESFFYLFNYDHLMHDARDYSIVYFEIQITKDFLGLKKGDTFEQCVFSMKDSMFHFETYDYSYEARLPDMSSPTTKQVSIAQHDLAPLMVWK